MEAKVREVESGVEGETRTGAEARESRDNQRVVETYTTREINLTRRGRGWGPTEKDRWVRLTTRGECIHGTHKEMTMNSRTTS